MDFSIYTNAGLVTVNVVRDGRTSGTPHRKPELVIIDDEEKAAEPDLQIIDEVDPLSTGRETDPEGDTTRAPERQRSDALNSEAAIRESDAMFQSGYERLAPIPERAEKAAEPDLQIIDEVEKAAEPDLQIIDEVDPLSTGRETDPEGDTTRADGDPEMNFSCSDCGKGFRLADNLIRHRRSHAQAARRFVCGLCKASFYDLHQLGTHMREHAGGEAPRPRAPGRRRFRCGECGLDFSRRGRLKIHEKTHVLDDHGVATSKPAKRRLKKVI